MTEAEQSVLAVIVMARNVIAIWHRDDYRKEFETIDAMNDAVAMLELAVVRVEQVTNLRQVES